MNIDEHLAKQARLAQVLNELADEGWMLTSLVWSPGLWTRPDGSTYFGSWVIGANDVGSSIPREEFKP